MEKTYRCPECLKSVTAEIIKKPRCKECKCPMKEVKKNSKIEWGGYKSSFYVPGKNEGKFRIGDKIVFGTKTDDDSMVRAIESAFNKGYN